MNETRRGIRVGVITTSFPRSSADDAGIFVARLVDALGEEGVSGEVIVPYDEHEPLTEQRGSFGVKRFHYGVFTRGRLAFGAGIVPNLKRSPSLLFQVPGLLVGLSRGARRVEARVDLYHANWVVSAFCTMIATRVSRIPYVVTLRGEDVRLLSRPFFRMWFTPALRRAAAVVSVNHSFIEGMGSSLGIPDSRLHVIPNGVSNAPPDRERAAALAQTLGIDEERPALLFVGTVIPRKKLERLVDALAEEKLSRFSLVVCGRIDDQGYVAMVQRRIADAGLGARVKFLGKTPPADIPPLMAICRYYVTASEFEGRPNAVLEALAQGLPVLASDIPAHREIIHDGQNGFLFRTIDALVTAINSTEGDEELRRKLGENARESVRGDNWDACARKYRALFESILASDR